MRHYAKGEGDQSQTFPRATLAYESLREVDNQSVVVMQQAVAPLTLGPRQCVTRGMTPEQSCRERCSYLKEDILSGTCMLWKTLLYALAATFEDIWDHGQRKQIGSTPIDTPTDLDHSSH